MACKRHLLRIALSPALVLALGLACPPSGHGADPVSATEAPLEHAIKAFDEAATRVNDHERERIARWTGTIHLAIADYSGMSRIATEIEAAVGELAVIARLNVVRVPWGDRRGNFTFRPSAGDPAGSGAPPCRSSVTWQDGVVQRAEIVVNLGNPGRVRRCVNHESMHGFGFRSHAHTAVSVLSYRKADQANLSWVDRLMLGTLYDTKLHPGMDGSRALPIACAIMADRLKASAHERTSTCAGRVPEPGRRLATFGARGNRN